MPDVLFTELIPQIDDLAELKVTLLVLWRLAQMRSDAAPWITQTELLHDPKVQAALIASVHRGSPDRGDTMPVHQRSPDRGDTMPVHQRSPDRGAGASVGDLAQREGDDLAQREGDDLVQREGDNLVQREGDDLAQQQRDDLAQREGEDPAQILEMALARAVNRGTLLVTQWERGDGVIEQRYFANSPRGRAAVAAIDRGQTPVRATLPERPNIFTLYEQNIGPLTPLMADELRDAEQTYDEAWIAEAFREAVRQNKRNWKYILAILERWRTEGQHGTYQQDRQEDRRRYIEGKYADIIRH
jgi:DnaD/phage-associated family protein